MRHYPTRFTVLSADLVLNLKYFLMLFKIKIFLIRHSNVGIFVIVRLKYYLVHSVIQFLEVSSGMVYKIKKYSFVYSNTFSMLSNLLSETEYFGIEMYLQRGQTCLRCQYHDAIAVFKAFGHCQFAILPHLVMIGIQHRFLMKGSQR